MVKPPSDWTEEDREKVKRAISEHRLSRVDLYFWQEVTVHGRGLFSLAKKHMLTKAEVERRVALATANLESTFERPSQEAYLGRWLST